MQLWTYLAPAYPLALFEELGRRIGAEVVVGTGGSGPDPGDHPLTAGRADVAWVCSTSFLQLRRHGVAASQVGVAWAPEGEERPEYHGVVVVPAGSTARSLRDLAGCRVGGNDAASLSGCHSYRIAVTELGEDPDTFAHLELTGSHARSLAAVRRGELDGAVIDSIVWSNRVRRDPTLNDQLTVVDRLGPWPTQPLIARPGLDPERIAAIREVLTAEPDPVLRALLDDAGLRALVAVDERHCDPVARMLTEDDLTPRC